MLLEFTDRRWGNCNWVKKSYSLPLKAWTQEFRLYVCPWLMVIRLCCGLTNGSAHHHHGTCAETLNKVPLKSFLLHPETLRSHMCVTVVCGFNPSVNWSASCALWSLFLTLCSESWWGQQSQRGGQYCCRTNTNRYHHHFNQCSHHSPPRSVRR